MLNWRRWIRPGLFVTGLLAVVAVLLQSGAVERDLAARTAERLSTDGVGWATVEVSGRIVTIQGTAPSTEAQAAAVESAEQVGGVSRVADASNLLASVSPYFWSVQKTGAVLTLSGFVPSEGFRTALLAAARRAMPAAEIRDQLQLARGAPPSFNSGTAFILDRLGALGDATVTMTDGTIAVTGVAADPVAFIAARNTFRDGLPAQLSLGPIDILPPRADPFTFSASYDGAAMALIGYAPNEIIEDSLLSAAREALPGATVTDRIEIASGAPEGFADSAAFAITVLTRLKTGEVVLDGPNLKIAGTARTVDDYDALEASAGGKLPRGLRIAAITVEPASVSPYGWRGERAGSEVTLAGYVPTRQAKQDLAEYAQTLFADATVSDTVRVAAGAPQMDWIGAVKFSMDQLSRLGRGSVVLGERQFSIEGEAASADAYGELLRANAQTLPASLELDGADVVPPRASPFRFAAARRPDSVVLDGHVQSEAERDSILSEARRKFGGVRLVDNLVFASGAPDGFDDAVKVAVAAVSRLAGGRTEVSDSSINIEGNAYHPYAAGVVVDAIGEAMPGGFDVVVSIAVRQPGQPVTPLRCRDLLQKVLMLGRIDFGGGKADVSDDSYGLLDRVAATIERCHDAAVEVGAHTDSDGSTQANLRLSQERAEAILEFLVDAGIKRERLTAVGYGEAKPIRDNETTEGKAANRRIEFVLTAEEHGEVVAEPADDNAVDEGQTDGTEDEAGDE
jgi:OOP family OmpA-OmpF porin